MSKLQSVEVEPHVQPLDDEILQKKIANVQDGVCLDIEMNGFWGGCHKRCCTDIKVFNPLASFNRKLAEKRANESRIWEVEKSFFTSLVFSATRGMGREVNVFTNE